MNKRLINTYVKYTAKKPILFFAMIIIFLFVIISLTLSTKTNVIIIREGTVDDNIIIINGIYSSHAGRLYVYTNRNEAVHHITIAETIHQYGKTFFVFEDNVEFLGKIEQQISVDIPVREITIFERLFLRGGRINE